MNDQLLSKIKSQNFSSSPIPGGISHERRYKVLWVENTANVFLPFEFAVRGGLCADRMAWVFIAGYQAAIRACFNPSQFENHKENHWLCLAVSEPKPQTGKSGVSVVIQGDDYLLTGFKSWIAASDSVDSLIVKAGRGEEAVCLYLPADAEHIKITKKRDPKMLAELSQGEAFFDNVRVHRSQALERLSLKLFPKFEAFYIFIAMAASIYTHTYKKDATTSKKALDFLEMAEEVTLIQEQGLARLEGVPDTVNQYFGELYEAYKASASISEFSSPADEGLLLAYSKMLDDTGS